MRTHPVHILITGGAGLIGTASKTYFEQRGWAVSTLDLKACDLDGREIDHVGDIVDFKSLQDILTDIDGILHLAAISRVIDAELDKEENVNGTKRLLEAASSANCQALKAKPLEIHGGGQLFDFTHIDDTAGAIFTAAELLHNIESLQFMCSLERLLQLKI